MAIFSGTSKKFKQYLGPFLRVFVQTITRKQKQAIGACEFCGAVGELEAAHKRGRSRTDIVNLLLGTSEPNAPVQVNLDEFKAAFKREHDSIEKSILVLCSACHTKYDSDLPLGVNSPSPIVENNGNVELPAGDDILPISLEPPHPDEFKARLLECREAIIEVHYDDGDVERRSWNASRFSATSNVFGNLRSRPEFRQGQWQSSGIVKVHVQVVDLRAGHST